MSERRPPDLLVEQLALGELDEARAAELRRELGESGPERLAAIAASNREILADYPPERVAADIRRRLERERKPSQRGRAYVWVLAPALAAAGVLVWVVTRDDGETTVAQIESTTGGGEITRLKGGVEPHLVIDRQSAGGHERLAETDGVGPGDVLQVSYVPAGRGEGVILSIDGAGVVTLHHPADANAPAQLGEGKEVPLADAYELDEAPGFERFLFVTRDDGPLEVADIMQAAEQLASDPDKAQTAPLELAGEGWMQHSLLLRKTDSQARTPAAASGEGDP